MTAPARDRPDIPEGYGVPRDDTALLSWSEVDRRIAESLHYWMATTRPDGRPHVVPRWGVWVNRSLFYDGSPETRHVRNLEENPHCSVHLGSGADAIILEGGSARAKAPGARLGRRLSMEFKRKYGQLGYEPGPEAWEGPDAGGLCVFTPSRALAWTSFPTDVTRFRLG